MGTLKNARIYCIFSDCMLNCDTWDNLYSINGACGDCGKTTKETYIEILEFTHFVDFFSFNRLEENHKEKVLVNKVTVVVALDLGTGNTKNPEI